MTETCIVGWAHSPFGKLEDADVESLIGRVAGAAIADAGIEPGASTASSSASSTAASPSRTSRRRCRCRPCRSCASSRRRAARTPARPARRRSTRRATSSRRAAGGSPSWSGVEKMTRDARPRRSATTCSARPTGARRATCRAASRACSAASPSAYFQRHGDQSDALAAIAAKNHRNGVDNPYAQMRKRPRLRLLPHAVRQEPARRRAAEAHGLLARQRRRGRAGAGRRRHGAGAARKRGAVPRGRPRQRLPAAVAPRPHRFEGGAWPGRGRSTRPGSRWATCRFVETHDCFTIAELIEYEAMGLAPPARARASCWTAARPPTGGCRSTAPAG